MFKKQLVKRGLVKEEPREYAIPKTKLCACGSQVGFASTICPRCRRSLDTDSVKQRLAAEHEREEVFSIAVEHPDLTFRDILERWKMETSHQQGSQGALQPKDSSSRAPGLEHLGNQRSVSQGPGRLGDALSDVPHPTRTGRALAQMFQ